MPSNKKILIHPPMPLSIGDTAPDFVLLDQDGKEHRLSDEKGHWTLLYFYPKDLTPGCMAEACGIRDAFPDFEKLNITVFGVSTDSVASHRKMVDKLELPFTLLADEKKEVVAAYGVWGQKKFMGHEYMGTNRWSFLIGPDGKIRKIYDKVKPAAHAQEVLEDLRQMG